MEFIHPEFIESLKGQQEVLSRALSNALSQVPEHPMSADIEGVATVKTSDLYAELAEPLLSVQFSFAEISDHPQAFLISEETALNIANLILDETIDAIDENLVSQIRAPLEALVQGTCLAAGQIREEPVVAANLAIRHQVFSLPPNLQRLDEVVRIQLELKAEESLGHLTWLMDAETAAAIVTHKEQEGEGMPFLQLEGGGHSNQSEDTGGIELLMDIPLEISVELGRVKMLVRDVVELGTGSIVEIDKAAGEPVDVMVNGRVVAKGEVVVIEDNFGVRITEILTPQERLQRLSEVA